MLYAICRKINNLLIRILPPYYLLPEKDETVSQELTDLDDFDF